MIDIVIVDDHDVVRSGLSGLLSDDPGFDVVGEAATGEQGIRLARELEPDIVLMDVELPGCSGLEATARIRRASQRVRVVVLTAHAEPPLPARLLEVGASGFLSKSSPAEELLTALRAVSRGERYLAADIAQQLALSMLPGTPDTPFEGLTPRELEVALMLAQGMRVKAIGEVMNLSPKTVATHKYRVYDKTRVSSEVELLRLALRYGLMNIDPVH
ncbi:response regulator [Wenzhouxiangella marina]|uniref:Response regulator n=1 Tax=Wenzhouxiangella marina TaxID=1579979 RepID=A0A0K0XVX7_9GAMM|nr:response regulator [Wenzhouxiangella marina]AKS41825.1 Response regulator [Wenzhouxiangella marina]MBB6086413.1 two-component system invasion response regulator UvrY [Wenzhouxiangella marina]